MSASHSNLNIWFSMITQSIFSFCMFVTCYWKSKFLFKGNRVEVMLRDSQELQSTMDQFVKERGWHFVSPFGDRRLFAGCGRWLIIDNSTSISSSRWRQSSMDSHQKGPVTMQSFDVFLCHALGPYLKNVMFHCSNIYHRSTKYSKRKENSRFLCFV